MSWVFVAIAFALSIVLERSATSRGWLKGGRELNHGWSYLRSLLIGAATAVLVLAIYEVINQ
jgi:hypothetical protein